MTSETTRRVNREFRKMAKNIFTGIAVGADLIDVHDQDPIEGVEYFVGDDGRRCIWVEQVSKFPKSRDRKIKHKHNPRLNVAAIDNMIVPVGKPGSQERLDALQAQYAAIEASGHEVSPFRDQ